MEIVCLKTKIIFSEYFILYIYIYISDSDVELAPSDNPTTSTYFRSILR